MLTKTQPDHCGYHFDGSNDHFCWLVGYGPSSGSNKESLERIKAIFEGMLGKPIVFGGRICCLLAVSS